MDFEDITLGEIEEIEDYAGLPIQMIGEMGTVGTHKLRIALAWIVKRRENPKFTIEDAKKLKTSELMTIMGGDDDEQKKG
jgi:hypothetical protein